MNKQQLIKKLSLMPHIEGGYFSRTYSSDLKTELSPDSKPRCLLSSIFYMLTDDSPIGYLHKNKSDIIHYFHGGSPLSYLIVHPDGNLERKVLGLDLDRGQQLQLIVRGGCWKATELETGEFGLISEAVSPGFEYDDMELAKEELIKNRFPHLWDQVSKYVR
ncbi:MAG: cupin domain-containing protein [Methylobacter sp.]|nr:MAG: cupin domain-containing protein [Methylobacter sp.]